MRALLDRLIDYAGVFPPANLPLAAAVREYREAVASADGWILGPMLLHASQVREYDGPGPIGVVSGEPIMGDFVQIETRSAPGDAARTIEAMAGCAPVLYVEATDSSDRTFLEAIGRARVEGHDVRAKIRTGGETASSFPAPAQVAGFINACVDRAIPFKATAGLHHPIRTRSLIAGATEHGFINMLAAVRCALSGRPEALEPCLSETEQAAFEMRSATWQGVGAEVSEEAIRDAMASIGSCSFEEPTGYLRRLELI